MAGKDIASDRLHSWKDIASYLGKDVRTAIRWEKQKGLPIHRVPGGQRQAVFAYKRELEAWLSGVGSISGNDALAAEKTSNASPVPTARTDPQILRRGSLPRQIVYILLAAALAGGVLAAMGISSASSRQLTGLVQLTYDGTPKVSLLTNGERLYFSERSDGRLLLSSVSVNGGPISHFTAPIANSEAEDISNDGKSLLVLSIDGTESERRLWILPAFGGQPTQVGPIRCHSAAWSQDGGVIAYATGDRIYVTSDRGQTSRQLGSFHVIPEMLRWSPDGRRLRFLLRDELGGTTPREITFGENWTVASMAPVQLGDKECCLAWAWERDGRHFFYSAHSAGRSASLTVLNEGNAWWKSWLGNAEVSTRLPRIGALATDAKSKKLFVLSEAVQSGELVVFNQVTQQVTPFAPGLGLSAIYIDFSRDGSRIAYVNSADGTLWISQIDGAQRKQLAASPMDVMLPRWSPDGAQLAFSAKQPGKPWRIFTVPGKGGALREASRGVDNQGAPAWTPDGKSLIYANVSCQESHTCGIHHIDLATGSVEEVAGSEGLRTARMSPNGRYIAALQPDRHELLLLDVSTHKWRKLLDSINGDDISWSRDSRFVYTNRPEGNNAAILRVAVDAGTAQVITELKSLNKLAGRIGDLFALAPDESIILWRRLDSSEIYALEWNSR